MLNANNSFYQNSMINARKDNDEWRNAKDTVPAPSELGSKEITENGNYSAKDDGLDGYSDVNVTVSNTYTAEDEGKVVDNGALVAQTAYPTEITENDTYDTTNYNSITVDVDSSFNTIQTIIINSDNEDKKVAIRRSNNGVYNISNSRNIEILLDPVVKIDVVDDYGQFPSISFTPAEDFDGIYKFGTKRNPTGDTITAGDGKLYKYYLDSWASGGHGTVTKHDTNFISIIS